MRIRRIKIPRKYKSVITEKNKHFLIPGGRISGKSHQAYLVATLFLLNNPDYDALIGRANYSEMETSSYNELKTAIKDLGMESEFEVYKSPLRIVRRGNHGTIYFTGLSGDENRTKGFKTEHPLGIFIIEETQQLKNQNELEQALASIRRNMDPTNWRIVIVYNPPAQKFNWINEYENRKKADPDFEIIRTTYKDVWPFLNIIDKREIIKDKLFDFNHYVWFYEGFGAVYSTFNPDIHLVKYGQWNSDPKYNILTSQIVGMIIGCDGSASKDATALVPIAILKNGICVVLNIFHHDPVNDGQFGSDWVVRNYVKQWFEKDICQKYNLNDRMAFVPILFVCDPAGSELAKALKYHMTGRPQTDVHTYQKETQLAMADKVIGGFARNQVFVIDYGGYQNYAKNQWIKGTTPLVKALTTVTWNEKGDHYDPAIPNDDTDALTYGLGEWFRNPLNVNWLTILSNLRRDYYIVK